MPGAPVSPYGRPLLKHGQMIDPHTGLPGATAEDVQRGAREAGNLKQAQYVMGQAQAGGYGAQSSYTDPSTGVVYHFNTDGSVAGKGAGSAAAAKPDYGLEDFDYNRSLAMVQGALPNHVPRDAMPGHVQASTPADAAAAEASEFGRAKDRIGRLGRGTLASMQDEFSSRGMGGSGLEAGATTNLLADLQGQEGEVIRDQNIQGLQRKRQVEDRNYAGDLNQRGQDIGFTTNQRGQDIDQERNRSQMQIPLLQLIAANRKRRTTPLY